MYCSYHTSFFARVQCGNCARALCQACDHRIKGYPYCQDCIVLGIEGLSRQHYQRSKPKTKSRIAALFAIFLPGLGAVYNRQNFKAVAHFVAVVGLFQFRHLFPFPAMFVLASFAFYLYSIIDAYRTAQRIAEGESPEADESRFKRELAKRAPFLGVTLIVAGVLLVIRILSPLAFITPARIMPVALIIFGGYLLTNYFKRSREEEYKNNNAQPPPYPLIPESFGEGFSSNVRRMSRPTNHRR